MSDKKITIEEAFKQAEEKAILLSSQLNAKVTPCVFDFHGDPVIGFMKEPLRITKYRYLDKAMNGAITAGVELLEAVLLKDQSDSRIYSEAQEFDDINLAAIMAAVSLIKTGAGALKKN